MSSTPDPYLDGLVVSPTLSSSPLIGDDASSSSFTATVVVFKGPNAALMPRVGEHIASQLALPPSSPLKVLDKAEFIQPPRHFENKTDPRMTKAVFARSTPAHGAWNEWRLNIYKTREKILRAGAERWYNTWHDWESVEIPHQTCSQPSAAPLNLFAGVVAFFSKYLVLNSGSGSSAYPNGSRSIVQSLMDVFEAFGGTVCSELSDETTHCISTDHQRGKRDDRAQLQNVYLVHPHWICLSVSLGALVPTSVFELAWRQPLTSPTPSASYPYRRTNGFLPSHTDPDELSGSASAPSLFTVVELVIGGLEPPTTALVPALIGRRVYFDISATPEGRRGAQPQLSEAVAAFVGRSGARVVRDVRAADWLVVSERSGDAYWHGLRNPTKTMGTLQHLLAHFHRVEKEPIDPRSNLLFFPTPATTAATPARLPAASVYISHHYPKDYRQYLAGLAEALDHRQRPLHVAPTSPYKSRIIISPTSELNQAYTSNIGLRKPAPTRSDHYSGPYACLFISDEDDLREDEVDPSIFGPRLLPKFLEDSFLLLDGPPIFDVDTVTFLCADIECFSPKKLPKNFHLAEHRPARLDDEDYNKLNDIEKQWKHHSSKEDPQGKYLCQCTSCRSVLY